MFIISLMYLFIYAASNNLRVTTMKVLGLLIDIHINAIPIEIFLLKDYIK